MSHVHSDLDYTDFRFEVVRRIEVRLYVSLYHGHINFKRVSTILHIAMEDIKNHCSFTEFISNATDRAWVRWPPI